MIIIIIHSFSITCNYVHVYKSCTIKVEERRSIIFILHDYIKHLQLLIFVMDVTQNGLEVKMFYELKL